MTRLFHSATYRVAFIHSVVFACAVLLLGTAVYLITDANFRREQDRTLTPEAARVMREYTEGGLADLAHSIQKRESRPHNIFSYAVITREGRHLIGSAALAQVGPGIHSTIVRRKDGAPLPGRVLGTPLGDGAMLYVVIDSAELDRLEDQLLILFGGGFLVVMLMGIGSALLQARHLKRRLERIAVAAAAIRAGDLGSRVAVGPDDDEFDRVGRSLNAMLDRIDALVTDLRQVSSDVAHDMRTPLSRLRGEIEAGLSGAADGVAQRRALARALERCDALLTLFNAILRIAEVEGQSGVDFAETIDLTALAAATCDMYAPAIEDGGRTLGLHAERPVHVAGNRELLTQAISNLLDNAQSHTPSGTAISLAVGGHGQEAWIVVGDDGPGVPEADRLRIAQRFVRLDKGRSRPGHGLGLNLVASIARAHGGDLRIEDNAPGLRAVVALRLAGAADAVTQPS